MFKGLSSVRTWLDGLLVDFSQVYRSLRTTKTFSLVAAATFALAIGVNVAVFSVVDRVLFRALPYQEPDRLTQVHLFAARIDDPIVAAMMPFEVTRALQQDAKSFDGVAFEAGWVESPVPEPGQNPLTLLVVSSNALQVLGVQPLRGRQFDEADSNAGAERPVVLTYEAWRSRFGGVEDVLSHGWETPRRHYRIVGVLPPHFLFPSSRFIEHIDGLTTVKDSELGTGRLTVAPVARLRRGVSWQAAQAELDSLMRYHQWSGSALRRISTEGQLKVWVQPLRRGLTMIVGPYLWLTSTVVWIVLGVGCANLSTLLLMRGQTQQQAMAVRAALGASGGRLVRLAVLESIVLCSVGAALGWAIYIWSRSAIVSIVPPTLRGFVVSTFDSRLLIVTITIACLSSAVVAIVPALLVRRTDLLSLVRAELPVSRRWPPLSAGAMSLGLEAAFGIVVTVGAVAIVPDFVRFLVAPAGFSADDVFTVTVNHDWPTGKDSDSIQHKRQGERLRTISEILSGLPHVAQVSAALPPPYASLRNESSLWKEHGLEGRELATGPGLFATLRVPLRAGREFSSADMGDARVAMVNETGAHALWPGESVASIPGHYIDMSSGPAMVVGVVRDTRARPGMGAPPDLYLPFASSDSQLQQTGLPIVLRMTPGAIPDPTLITARLDERFPPNGIRIVSVAEQMAPLIERPRFLAVLFGVVAAVVVVLIGVGVYAVASVECDRRRREMAIRLALGASPRRVRGHVLINVLSPVLAGSVIGLLVARAGGHALQASVRELSAPSPLIYVIGTMLITSAALLAAWPSSRRLSETDPAAILRTPT